MTTPGLSYSKLEEAAEQVLKLLGQVVNVNTLYISVNDGKTNLILRALNRKEILTKPGGVSPLYDTYCSLVTSTSGETVIVPHTTESPLTSELELTKRLGDTSFIGVPIVLEDNTICGTICGIDNHGYEFSNRDADFLRTMATFLGYVVHLESIAFRDSLTKAFNRNFIDLYLTDNWKSKYKSVAFLFVDIDNFKQINDTYGHGIGDEVLQQVAKKIQERIRKSDMVFRVGGDEFVLVIPDYGDDTTLKRVVDSILGEFDYPIHTKNKDVSVSLSVGVSTYPKDGQDMEQLLKRADDAMYQVKQEGKSKLSIV